MAADKVDPIHQFQIHPIIPIHIGGYDVSFTNSALFMVATVIVSGFSTPECLGPVDPTDLVPLSALAGEGFGWDRCEGDGAAWSSTRSSNAPICPFAERIVPFTTGNSATRGGVSASDRQSDHSSPRK